MAAIPQQLTLSRVPKSVQSRRAYVGGRLKTVRSVAPKSAALVRGHTPSVHIQTMQNCPPGLLSNTARYSAHVDAEFHRCNTMTLAFDLTVSGQTTAIPPSWKWSDRVAIRAGTSYSC